jgi:hypothetical protein
MWKTLTKRKKSLVYKENTPKKKGEICSQVSIFLSICNFLTVRFFGLKFKIQRLTKNGQERRWMWHIWLDMCMCFLTEVFNKLNSSNITFFCYHNIGTKFPPLLAMTNLRRGTCVRGIESLSTCLRGQSTSLTTWINS